MPVFSIVIPVYNAEKYLAQCVESVLAQTFRDFEVFLVHDISEDRSGELCNYYAASDHRVTVVHGEKQGVSTARNRGIELSAGDWIAFIDADDWAAPDMLEIALDHLAANNCDVLLFDALVEYHTRRKTGRSILFEKPFVSCDRARILEIQKEIVHPLLTKDNHGFITGPWGKIYKSEVLRNFHVRFPDGINFGEDQWFNFFFFNHIKKIQYIDAPLYHYRIHDDSVSCRYKKDYNAKLIKMIEFADRLVNGESSDCSVFAPYFYAKTIMCFLELLRNILHKDSPLSFKDKYLQIKDLCEEPYFYNASRRVELERLSFWSRVACHLIKSKRVLLLILYNKLKYLRISLKERMDS